MGDDRCIIRIEYDNHVGWTITWPWSGRWSDSETRENIIKAVDLVDDFVKRRDEIVGDG